MLYGDHHPLIAEAGGSVTAVSSALHDCATLLMFDGPGLGGKYRDPSLGVARLRARLHCLRMTIGFDGLAERVGPCGACVGFVAGWHG